MYSQRLVRLGLTVTMLAVLVCSACGGNRHISKPQPLPEERQELRTGVYRSEEFKPSLTFRVGEGWSNEPPEMSDALLITRGHDIGGLGFANIREVYAYKPTRMTYPLVVDAPEDLVGWLKQHPYLRTSQPQSVTVGGVKGQQLDVVVEGLPEDYYSECGSDCVEIFRLGEAYPVALWEGDKARFIVLQDVKGEMVVVGFVSPIGKFEEYAQEAQKVIDTVEWRDE